MRTTRIVLILAMIGGIYSVAPRAWACSCAGPGPTDAEAYPEYDVIFVGDAAGKRFARSGGDHPDQIWTFEVDRVNRGGAYEVQEVRTPHDGGICAFPFRKGRTYQVWGDERGGALHTALCDKTRQVRAAGDAYEPRSYPPDPVPDGGAGGLPATGVAAGGVIALIALGAAGALATGIAPRRTRTRG